MSSGKGIADIVFIPASSAKLPAMVVELKWNKTAGRKLLNSAPARIVVRKSAQGK